MKFLNSQIFILYFTFYAVKLVHYCDFVIIYNQSVEVIGTYLLKTYVIFWQKLSHSAVITLTMRGILDILHFKW